MMHKHIITIIFLLIPISAIEAQDYSAHFCFDLSGKVIVKIPDGYPDRELDELEESNGSYYAILIDINDDGSKEYFFPSACGNGGCEFKIFSTDKNITIGNVFGSLICVLRERKNDMPLLLTYSHVSALSGNIITYEFNGKQYVNVSTRYVEGEENESYYDNLAKVPRQNNIFK